MTAFQKAYIFQTGLYAQKLRRGKVLGASKTEGQAGSGVSPQVLRMAEGSDKAQKLVPTLGSAVPWCASWGWRLLSGL